MFRLSRVVLFIVLCSKGHGQLTGGCSPKFDIPCIWRRFTGNECSPENLLEKFPFYATNATDFSRQPESFEADAAYRAHSNGHWYPAVNLTFTTSQDVMENYMKGFEIVRYDVSNQSTCFILDLSNITSEGMSRSENVTKFWLDIFPLNPNPYPLYRFEVYTLPKPANKDYRLDHQLNLNVEFPGYMYSNPEMAREWKATTSLSRNYNTRSINVTIATPPDKYGFTLFIYALIDNTSNNIIYYENSSQLWHEFTDVPPGVYKIWITPVKDSTRRYNGCACSDGLVCYHCLTTETHGFTFNYRSEPFEGETSTMLPMMETTTGSEPFEGESSTMLPVMETTTGSKIKEEEPKAKELYQQEVQISQLRIELLKQRLQQEKDIFSMQVEMMKYMRDQDRKLFKIKRRLLSRNFETSLDQI